MVNDTFALMFQRKFILICALVVALGSRLLAQQGDAEDQVGNWIMYFGANRISDVSSIHTEGQIRLWNIDRNLNQVLLRTGYNYHINEDNLLTAGYAFVYTDEYATTKATREHRIWQQFIQRHAFDRLQFEHRYRFEQRWVLGSPREDLQARGRYRLLVNVLLGEGGSSPFFLSFYDEIFLRFTEAPFDQNRLYGALAYRFTNEMNLQVGYLMNTFQDVNYHRVQFMLIYNPDLR